MKEQTYREIVELAHGRWNDYPWQGLDDEGLAKLFDRIAVEVAYERGFEDGMELGSK